MPSAIKANAKVTEEESPRRSIPTEQFGKVRVKKRGGNQRPGGASIQPVDPEGIREGRRDGNGKRAAQKGNL